MDNLTTTDIQELTGNKAIVDSEYLESYHRPGHSEFLYNVHGEKFASGVLSIELRGNGQIKTSITYS